MAAGGISSYVVLAIQRARVSVAPMIWTPLGGGGDLERGGHRGCQRLFTPFPERRQHGELATAPSGNIHWPGRLTSRSSTRHCRSGTSRTSSPSEYRGGILSTRCIARREQWEARKTRS